MGLKADGFIRLTLPDPPILTLLWLPYLLLSPKTDNYRFDRKSVGERIFHGHIRTQRPRKVLNRSLKHQCHVPVAKNRLFLKTGNFRSLPVCLFKHTNFAKFGVLINFQGIISENDLRDCFGDFSLVKPEIFRKKIRILPNLLKMLLLNFKSTYFLN